MADILDVVVDSVKEAVTSDVGKAVLTTAASAGTQALLNRSGAEAERRGIKEAGAASQEGINSAIETQLEQFAAQLQFQREQAVNERALAERLQNAAINADAAKLSMITNVFDRAIALEEPFQKAAEGFISPLQRALSEFPEFKPILDEPISDAEISRNIPKALTDLQQFQFGEVTRVVDRGLAASGLTGSGAGARARVEALRPLSLDFALQGFEAGQNRVLLNESRAVNEEQRKVNQSLGNIGALAGALGTARSNNQLPALLSGKANAIGRSADRTAALNQNFGGAQLAPLTRFGQQGGTAFNNLGTNLSTLLAQGGLNLANTQFKIGESRANQAGDTARAVSQAVTDVLRSQSNNRLAESINNRNRPLN